MNRMINLLEDEILENFKRGTNEQINKFIGILHSLPYESILENAETMLAGGHIIGDKSAGFQGSSRKVYILPGYKVLKLAFDARGRESFDPQDRQSGCDQNEAEVKIWNAVNDKEILAEIYDYDNRNYDWVIMEYAKTARRFSVDEKNAKVKQKYNLDNYTDILIMIENIVTLPSEKIVAMQRKYFPEQDFLNKPPLKNWINFKRIVPNFEGDLHEENIGFTKDNRLVAIDYGFTSEVVFNHYR